MLKGHDLLVEIKAVSGQSCRREGALPRGAVPLMNSKVLGWDAAGIVKAVGPRSRSSKPAMKSSTPARSTARVPMPNST